jgi:hypothetical protein
VSDTKAEPMTGEEIEIARHNMTRYWYDRLLATLDAAQKEVERLTVDYGSLCANGRKADRDWADLKIAECNSLKEQIRTLTEERDNWKALHDGEVTHQAMVVESLRAENERLRASTEVSEMAAMYARGLEDTATITALRQQSDRQRKALWEIRDEMAGSILGRNECIYRIAREALAPAEPTKKSSYFCTGCMCPVLENAPCLNCAAQSEKA